MDRIDIIDIIVLCYTVIVMIFAYWLRSERKFNVSLIDSINEVRAISEHQSMLLEFIALPKLDESTPEMTRMVAIDKAKRLYESTKGFLLEGRPKACIIAHLLDFRQLCTAIGFNEDEIAVITGDDSVLAGDNNAVGETVPAAETKAASDATKNI